MNEFYAYSPEDVIACNLRETAERTRLIWEQEMAHLRELAHSILEETANDTELADALPEQSPPRFRDLFADLRADPRFGQQLERFCSTEHSIYLCMELCKQLRRRSPLVEESLFGDAEEIAEHAKDHVIYQRSSYADSAYLAFAPLLDAPRAFYTHSFSAVCEEVYNGLAEFCILPLESSAEGQLNSFSRLIDRFALKLVATCDIPATDGVRSTRFALLRRDLIPLKCLPAASDSFFACSFPLSATPSVAELLQAAQLSGLTLCRLDTRAHDSADNDQGELFVHAAFSVGKGDLTAFLLYLAMEAPTCEPDGCYFHIDGSFGKSRKEKYYG